MTKVKVGGSKTCKVRKSICCRKVGGGIPPPRWYMYIMYLPVICTYHDAMSCLTIPETVVDLDPIKKSKKKKYSILYILYRINIHPPDTY